MGPLLQMKGKLSSITGSVLREEKKGQINQDFFVVVAAISE